MTRLPISPKSPRKATLLAAGVAAAALAASGCSSGSTKSAGAAATSGSTSGSPAPGTSFSTRSVSGLGTVVVDGRGRTVYVLTSGGHTNVPCTDSSGCTRVWPDLPLPSGVTAARAGSGIQPSLLGTTKLSDGETYATYNGWLMYEYAADSGPGQAGGQGIKSFGGTWYVLSPAGTPISSASGSASNGGYTY